MQEEAVGSVGGVGRSGVGGGSVGADAHAALLVESVQLDHEHDEEMQARACQRLWRRW